MAINIYESDSFKKVAWLCDDVWDLPTQVDELEKWLKLNLPTLANSEYVADIGFDIRKDSAGGGAVMSVEMIRLLSKANMAVYLSEYPEAPENGDGI